MSRWWDKLVGGGPSHGNLYKLDSAAISLEQSQMSCKTVTFRRACRGTSTFGGAMMVTLTTILMLQSAVLSSSVLSPLPGHSPSSQQAPGVVNVSKCRHTPPDAYPIGRGKRGAVIKGTKLYVIPFLVHGPANQVMELKNALMLAKLLGRAVILPAIFRHYSEGIAAAGQAAFFQYEALFNRSSLQSVVDTATAEEVSSLGWDGGINALLFNEKEKFHGGECWTEYFYQQLKQVAPNAHLLSNLETFGWTQHLCGSNDMKTLKEGLKKHRGLDGVGGGVSLMHQGEPLIRQTPSVKQTIMTAKSMRKQSDGQDFDKRNGQKGKPLVSKASKIWIREKFKGKPFLAAHVRPYPDECLHIWAKPGEFPPPDVMNLACSKDSSHLHLLLVSTLERVVNQTSIRDLFIISHPAIRPRIKAMLEKVKLRTTCLEADDPVMVRLYSDTHSARGGTSLLMFMEQAIAMHATGFVGTSSSSATWMMAQARLTEWTKGGKIAAPKNVKDYLF